MSIDNPSPYEIQNVISAWNNAREELLRNDSADDLYIYDLAQLTETEQVKDLITRLVRSSMHAEAMYKAADQMATEREIRARRYQKRFERLRKAALEIMVIVGAKQLEQPDFTFYLRGSPPSVKITGDVPEKYIRTKVIREPDKIAIAADLKQGVVIEGATLDNPKPHSVLDVR